MKSYFYKRRVILISFVTILLLLGLTTYISFAFYKTTSKETIIGGKVGVLTNLRILVEDKDKDGNNLNTYSHSTSIPEAGYVYNSNKSYCKNGSTISYDSTTNKLNQSDEDDLCYAYFDVDNNIELNIYIADSESETGYKKVDEIPNDKTYTLNSDMSSCTNSGVLTYEDNEIKISSSSAAICEAYLD